MLKAYAVIPLSAESVNLIEQLLTDRNLALQPSDVIDPLADSPTSSNIEDNSQSMQGNPTDDESADITEVDQSEIVSSARVLTDHGSFHHSQMDQSEELMEDENCD
uniref:Uncharacterized protein n=1 Tax=Daphnia galeata TaxID=27404 RepID=A0A8J2RM83_9CRUS|nr:unnamed protein product [Daphnia galeata]